MQQYRIYCLNEEGRYSKVHEIEVATDAEALACARKIDHHGPCEVWNGGRLVGKIGEIADATAPRTVGARR